MPCHAMRLPGRPPDTPTSVPLWPHTLLLFLFLFSSSLCHSLAHSLALSGTLLAPPYLWPSAPQHVALPNPRHRSGSRKRSAIPRASSARQFMARQSTARQSTARQRIPRPVDDEARLPGHVLPVQCVADAVQQGGPGQGACVWFPIASDPSLRSLSCPRVEMRGRRCNHADGGW